MTGAAPRIRPASPSLVEDQLYQAEGVRAGGVVDLTLGPGDRLVVGLSKPRSGRRQPKKSPPPLHLVEDDLALCLVPPVGLYLAVRLDNAGATMAPLEINLIRDVAVALTKPATGRLSIRPARQPRTFIIERIAA